MFRLVSRSRRGGWVVQNGYRKGESHLPLKSKDNEVGCGAVVETDENRKARSKFSSRLGPPRRKFCAALRSGESGGETKGEDQVGGNRKRT